MLEILWSAIIGATIPVVLAIIIATPILALGLNMNVKRTTKDMLYVYGICLAISLLIVGLDYSYQYYSHGWTCDGEGKFPSSCAFGLQFYLMSLAYGLFMPLAFISYANSKYSFSRGEGFKILSVEKPVCQHKITAHVWAIITHFAITLFFSFLFMEIFVSVAFLVLWVAFLIFAVRSELSRDKV